MACHLTEEGGCVLGRACGDRVACVSLLDCCSFKETLCVGLHELLHTLGFDHCNSWQCVLNATGDAPWLYLSPVNLSKLKHMHSIPIKDNIFVLKRYNSLLPLVEGLDSHTGSNGGGGEFQVEKEWLNQRIQSMHALGL